MASNVTGRGQVCPAENSSTTVSPPGTTDMQEEEKFCNGYGTDMYMSGFKVSSTVIYCGVQFTSLQWAGDPAASCVILIFPSWLLTTRSRHCCSVLSITIICNCTGSRLPAAGCSGSGSR